MVRGDWAHHHRHRPARQTCYEIKLMHATPRARSSAFVATLFASRRAHGSHRCKEDVHFTHLDESNSAGNRRSITPHYQFSSLAYN